MINIELNIKRRKLLQQLFKFSANSFVNATHFPDEELISITCVNRNGFLFIKKERNEKEYTKFLG